MGAAKDYLTGRDEAIDALGNWLRRIDAVKAKHRDLNALSLLSSIILARLDDTKMHFNAVRQIQQSARLIDDALRVLESPDAASREAHLAVSVLEHAFSAMFQLLNDEDEGHDSASGLNSAQYYERQIAALQKQKDELEQLIHQQRRQAKQSSQQQAETEKQREETARELDAVRKQLEQMQKENAARKRREDAQTQLKADIQATFGELNAYSAPFEAEKLRLNVLFAAYALLSVATLVVLVLYECHFMHRIKLESLSALWTNYIPFYLPVPLCAGLLWAFIFQMNRAQRQLVVLTDKLHHVKYIEGLLLAIARLSTDMAEGASKIRQTIDRIIDNYLHQPHDLTETRLLKEQSKDRIDLGQLTKLMGEIKELVKK